jgi:hypothetical protein
MSAGEFVYENINAIIKYCDTVDGDELELLLDADYSKKTFNINFPFFIDAADIDETNTKKQSRRFRKDVYTVRGRRVRVTSQWLYTHLPCFYGYLERKNIRPVVPMPEGIKKTNGGKTKSKPAAKVNNRNAIGNAANLLVRNILSNLGDETFDENDWLETQKFFNGGCAYCGSGGELEKDHAVPINKEKLGEHKIGNIVPSSARLRAVGAGALEKRVLV